MVFVYGEIVTPLRDADRQGVRRQECCVRNPGAITTCQAPCTRFINPEKVQRHTT
jgi:hypothetical protein